VAARVKREVLMTRALIVVAGLACGAIVFGQSNPDGHVIEQPFPEGGLVTMNLSSGDYLVQAGTSDRIRVHWRADEARHERDMEKITVRTDLFGKVATIRTKGPTSRARFTIEIPGRSDLHLRIRAGDVRIVGIDGNKDVRMTAGDLDIDVAPDSLWHVHASVALGDLTAHPLGIEKDGIKNSLNWFGPGAYTLDARVFAGDMTLR
jgi:hypothetical protein